MKKILRKTVEKRPRIFLKIFLVLSLLFFLGVLILFILNSYVTGRTDACVYSLDGFVSGDASADHYDAVIVLGCAVWADGASPMLADRLRTAAAVYKTGCADYILATGDSEEPEDYDETGVMKEFLINEGIDAGDIVCDPLGLSTYESMLRAFKIFGIRSAVIVTTGFHCHRSVYDSQMFGIRSVGVEAINSGYVIRQYNYQREFVARGKDFVFTLIKPGYKD
ncbi:MAG: YdcF family protein [Clostridiales bacterium]|nr:YdcF family protein [Clostridiales bacterium]